MSVEIVSQAEAGRRKGVSRQRIGQLVAQGRLNVPKDAKGQEIRGMVFLKEVLELKHLDRGRPKLSEGERSRPRTKGKQSGHGFSIEDDVIWQHHPRDGHGHRTVIPAVVKQIGNTRVRVEYDKLNRRGEFVEKRLAWVKPEQLSHVEDVVDGQAAPTHQGSGSEVVGM